MENTYYISNDIRSQISSPSLDETWSQEYDKSLNSKHNSKIYQQQSRNIDIDGSDALTNAFYLFNSKSPNDQFSREKERFSTAGSKYPSLEEILSGNSFPPFTLARFTRHAAHSHCLENLEFLLDVLRFKTFYNEKSSAQKNDNDQLINFYKSIVSTYIIQNSLNEINIPCENRTVLLNLNNDDKKINFNSKNALLALEDAYEIVKELVRDSTYVSFIGSCEECLSPSQRNTIVSYTLDPITTTNLRNTNSYSGSEFGQTSGSERDINSANSDIKMDDYFNIKNKSNDKSSLSPIIMKCQSTESSLNSFTPLDEVLSQQTNQTATTATSPDLNFEKEGIRGIRGINLKIENNNNNNNNNNNTNTNNRPRILRNSSLKHATKDLGRIFSKKYKDAKYHLKSKNSKNSPSPTPSQK